MYYDKGLELVGRLEPHVIQGNFSDRFDELFELYRAQFLTDLKYTLDLILEPDHEFLGLTPQMFARYRNRNRPTIVVDLAYSAPLRSLCIVLIARDLDIKIEEEAETVEEFLLKLQKMYEALKNPSNLKVEKDQVLVPDTPLSEDREEYEEIDE